MAEYLYFYPLRSVRAIKDELAAFEALGYDTDTVQFGRSWNEFLSEVPDHSTVVVHSVDFFSSLMELLSTLAELQERGITLRSLQEPWLSQEVGSTADFLLKLRELAVLLHTNRTREGLEKARAQGKKLGLPAPDPAFGDLVFRHCATSALIVLL